MDALFIKQALANRHPIDKGWIYLTELRTKSGFADTQYFGGGLSQVRSLDAFAMHTWASKKFRRVGYEVKVSRSDWKVELANMAKHLQGYYLTHEFWFALAEGIYRREDDCPAIEGCGILEVAESGDIRIIAHPHHHEAYPMPETFIASLLNMAMRSSAQYAAAYAEIDAAGRGQEPMPAQVPVKLAAVPIISPFAQMSLMTAQGEESA